MLKGREFVDDGAKTERVCAATSTLSISFRAKENNGELEKKGNQGYY